MQDQKFLLVNIYAPNKTSEQTLFFDKIRDELDNTDIPYLPEYKSIPCISRPPIFEAIN